MIHFKLPPKVTRAAGKLMLKARAAAPEICVITGFGFGIASLITVGVKTWKNKDILSADKKRIDEIKALGHETESKIIVEVDQDTGLQEDKLQTITKDRKLTKEEKKELLGARIDLTLDSIKTYIIPVGEAAIAGILIWKGRSVLRGRLAASTALVAALTEENRRLLQQIEEKHGAEEAEEMAYKIDEEGRVEKDDQPHTFSFVFGPGIWNKEKQEWYHKNYKWKRSKVDNQFIVKQNQDWARRVINTTQGWISYGDIVREFDCPTEPWMFNWGIWREDGDVYLDFHVFDSDQQLEINRRFMDMNDPTNVCVIQVDGVRCLDDIFANPEKYDKRFGTRPKKMPTIDEMTSAEYTKELAKGGCYV